MGILDLFSDPANQGILNLASGLLQASGPSRMPVSFGQALGQGMQQGTNAFQQAQQAQMQQELMRLRQAALTQQANQPIVGSPGSVFLDPATKQPIFTVPFKPEAPQEPKAPTSRKIRIGNEEVTQEYDPKTMQWREVGRGPAFSDKPAVKVDIHGKGDSKYLDKRLEGEAAAIEKLYSSADTAFKSNTALDRIAQNNEESFAGAAAPLIAGTANFLSSFGYDPKSLTSTATVDQAISEMLATRMSELGARGLTDKDMEVLRSNLPKVNQSKAARLAVVAVLKKSNEGTILEAQKRRTQELEQYPELRTRTRNYQWEKYKPSAQKDVEAPKTPQTFPTPSQAAISRLKMNPAERTMFESVFGEGSAGRYLNGR